LFLSIDLFNRAGGSHLLAFLAQVIVEVVANVILGQVIGDGFTVLLGLNDVLALIGFFERTFGAFAFPSNSDLAFVDSERRRYQKQSGQPCHACEQTDVFFHSLIGPVMESKVRWHCWGYRSIWSFFRPFGESV